jgi:NADH-quinone oxidoreductase subunit J
MVSAIPPHAVSAIPSHAVSAIPSHAVSAILANAATSATHLAHASAWAVFLVGAAMILTGALGVVLLRNPVHCALMLVITLFGIALLFIDQSADFLAAVQIIVYAGAVVILFLFVIMFLGVDRKEAVATEPTRFQRPAAILIALVILVEILVLSQVDNWSTGTPSQAGALDGPGENVQKLGQLIFTGYLLPFEMTAALLVIAVVGAVVLSRRNAPVSAELAGSAPPRDGGVPGPDEAAGLENADEQAPAEPPDAPAPDEAALSRAGEEAPVGSAPAEAGGPLPWTGAQADREVVGE